MNKQANNTRIQGEGDYDAAERFNESSRDFVDSGKVDKAPDPTDQSRESADKAERKGKSRAKEFDPQEHRDYGEATDD
jgi:hypothetical protein